MSVLVATTKVCGKLAVIAALILFIGCVVWSRTQPPTRGEAAAAVGSLDRPSPATVDVPGDFAANSSEDLPGSAPFRLRAQEGQIQDLYHAVAELSTRLERLERLEKPSQGQ